MPLIVGAGMTALFVFLFWRGFTVAFVSQETFKDVTPALTEGIRVQQTVPTKNYVVDSLDLRFGTFKRRNSGSVIELQLHYIRNGGLISSQTRLINAETLIDNAMNRIYVEPLSCREDGILQIVLQPLLTVQGREVSLWVSESDAFAGGELFINNRPVKKDLSFRLNGRLRGMELPTHLQKQLPGRPQFRNLLMMTLILLFAGFLSVLYILILLCMKRIRADD